MYQTRKSLTGAGVKRCVSLIERKRAATGISKGKSRSVALMLLCSVPPSEACKPPAPNGRLVSELEKKKRAPSLSLLALNSLSQLVVNWSSVYFPGLLTSSGPLDPGVPAIEGIRNPLGSLKRSV